MREAAQGQGRLAQLPYSNCAVSINAFHRDPDSDERRAGTFYLRRQGRLTKLYESACLPRDTGVLQGWRKEDVQRDSDLPRRGCIRNLCGGKLELGVEEACCA